MRQGSHRRRAPERVEGAARGTTRPPGSPRETPIAAPSSSPEADCQGRGGEPIQPGMRRRGQPGRPADPSVRDELRDSPHSAPTRQRLPRGQSPAKEPQFHCGQRRRPRPPWNWFARACEGPRRDLGCRRRSQADPRASIEGRSASQEAERILRCSVRTAPTAVGVGHRQRHQSDWFPGESADRQPSCCETLLGRDVTLTAHASPRHFGMHRGSLTAGTAGAGPVVTDC